jgi:hypothetical protein
VLRLDCNLLVRMLMVLKRMWWPKLLMCSFKGSLFSSAYVNLCHSVLFLEWAVFCMWGLFMFEATHIVYYKCDKDLIQVISLLSNGLTCWEKLYKIKKITVNVKHEDILLCMQLMLLLLSTSKFAWGFLF